MASPAGKFVVVPAHRPVHQFGFAAQPLVSIRGFCAVARDPDAYCVRKHSLSLSWFGGAILI